MSYSRWSDSVWYTFWNTSSGKTKDEQILSLWYSFWNTRDITYQELKELAEDKSIHDMIIWKYKCNVDEAKEAVKYIKRFIQDVEEEFDTPLDQITEK